jgi:hypothetical protein
VTRTVDDSAGWSPAPAPVALVDDGPGTKPRPAGTAVDGVTPASLEGVTHDYAARRAPETQELVDRHEAHVARFPRADVGEGAIVHRHYGVSPDDVEPDTLTGDAAWQDYVADAQTAPSCASQRRDLTPGLPEDLEPQDGPRHYGPPEGEPYPTHEELDRLRLAGWNVDELESIPTARFETVRNTVEADAMRTRRRPR